METVVQLLWTSHCDGGVRVERSRVGKKTGEEGKGKSMMMMMMMRCQRERKDAKSDKY